MYSEEGWSGDNDPTWLGIGYMVGDIGLLVLLLTTGFAFWWSRSKKPVAGRIVAGLSVALSRAARHRVARDVGQMGLLAPHDG